MRLAIIGAAALALSACGPLAPAAIGLAGAVVGFGTKALDLDEMILARTPVPAPLPACTTEPCGMPSADELEKAGGLP